MPRINYQGKSIPLAQGETVLEALLRSGVKAAHSCRSGTCQSCLLRCTEGTPPEESQQGLKQTLRIQGYFLPCVCRPTEDMTIAPANDAVLQCSALVDEVSRLSENVVRLRLLPEGPFSYRAGQFLNLIRQDGLVRSYSLASLPEEDEHLELHVREIPGGRMSRWISRELRRGVRVGIRGPAGECFYVPGEPERDTLLVGTGTGLAPLYGIVKDALRQGHKGRLALFHGAIDRSGLYLVEELQALSRAHPNFTYTRCLLRGEPEEGVFVGNIQEIVRNHLPVLSSWRVYLCGDPQLVQSMRRAVFLGGASMKAIHADPFVMASA